MQHNEIIMAVLGWVLKEAYQSFVGYRAKQSEKLDTANKDISILKLEMRNALLKVEELQKGIDYLRVQKREYR